MLVLVLIVGVAIGWMLADLFFNRKTTSGYFTIEPYDEDDTGFYCVNMRIPPENQDNLLDKKRIVLYREHSQK